MPRTGLSPQEALPGLATAVDEHQIKGYLQAALFGNSGATYSVERCTPAGSLYMPGECCDVRYLVQARNIPSGEILEPIVGGRVFPNATSCARYMSDKLAPLAARLRGRREIAAFAAPAVMIEPLNMVAHVWPIDGELPTLVEATDRLRMIEVFRETLPDMPEQQFVVNDCAIELVNYRRRRRCVLRYTIAGNVAGSHEFRRLIVYGKVTAPGHEPLDLRSVDALRDEILQRGERRFTLPRSFGWRPDLQLSLLEAMPGTALILPAIEARLRGQPPPGALSLEEMIAACGQVAATLHISDIKPRRAHTLDDELADLRRAIMTTRQFAADVADRAESWLERIAAVAKQSEPLQLSLCHGDFYYEQMLFSPAGCGLLDLDTICLAEPALDVGKFLAYLRAQAMKLQKRASLSSPLVEELGEHFLRAYVSAAGDHLRDERHLRLRATIYENATLLRMALRSQQKLNQSRLKRMTALLEERIS